MRNLFRTIFFFCWMTLLPVGVLSAPAIAQTQIQKPICSITTPNGTVIDLRASCQQVDPNAVPSQPQQISPGSSPSGSPTTGNQNSGRSSKSVSYPTPPNVYDYPAMREFDRKLYGD
jgi:hypothetical protein